MLFKIDVEKLVENLKNSEEIQPVEQSAGVQYLMETVYNTLLADRPLTVGSIDFERFDHEEIWDFKEHIVNNLEEKKEEAETVMRLMHKYWPKTAPRQAFF